ncbi:hybrid sensor histidine kinase/response regulator [Paraburkholderia sp.]|uniref:hybrid sensor histidine kinase/response regulator n=1 Tax=Paraburkholderia sp. TaxID=1926495 RepID=UPI0023A62A54|nr:hybrid sensor histidine kinase/response regulator [Paraburkholderia sp.]MDE1179244.1 response regulator [Paraburkholderia sp.]
MRYPDNLELGLPLPSRNFQLTRRILRIVLIASILFPAGSLCVYEYFDYQSRLADANEAIDRLDRVAEEHAVKVLDLNQQMSARIIELLGDDDDELIRKHEQQLHNRLQLIGGDFPQVSGVGIFNAEGRLLAGSRTYPVPPIYVANREDFNSAKSALPDPYFSLPMHGRMSQAEVFNTTIARSASDGRFLGVVSISLRNSYFSKFYRDLIAGNPALAIGLYRQDGSLLVRYPNWAPGTHSAVNSPFSEALRNHQQFGRVRLTSSVDGTERLLSFRRVGDYPLYVASGYAASAVVAQWFRHLMIVAMVIMLPCAAIWCLILFSLRQLDAERLSWERWQAEQKRRLSAEESSRALHRMGALGNLVANVAHDFNNLLMVVAANTDIARTKNFNGLEREVMAVERAASGAQSLARRLLSVARKQPLKPEVVMPLAWLPAIATFAKAALGDNVQLLVDVADDAWPVYVDAKELEFSIMNIAVNARDAMNGRGRFAIRCQNVRYSAADVGMPVGEFVMLAFSDDGVGMREDVARRAFEPLFTTKAHGSGTGLGLAQVQAMCEDAGGSAAIETVEGHGTTVRLYLPRSRVAAAASHAHPPPEAARESTQGTVLVVEDNEEVAAGVAAVLETFGLDVRVAATADEASDRLEHGETFELVLSDIQMPGEQNGLDLAEQIRVRWPAQNVALMTGFSEDLDRAAAIGVTVLSKPFDIATLHEVVMDACQRRAQAS